MRLILALMSVLLIPGLPCLAARLLADPLVRWAVGRSNRMGDDTDRPFRLPFVVYAALIGVALTTGVLISWTAIDTLI